MTLLCSSFSNTSIVSVTLFCFLCYHQNIRYKVIVAKLNWFVHTLATYLIVIDHKEIYLYLSNTNKGTQSTEQ